MPNFAKLMKQAAEMQKQMQQVQGDLANRTVDATAGGGLVKVTATCDGTIAAVKIDPKAIQPEEAQLLEDLVLSGVNQALLAAKEAAAQEMSKVTGGLGGLPGLM